MSFPRCCFATATVALLLLDGCSATVPASPTRSPQADSSTRLFVPAAATAAALQETAGVSGRDAQAALAAWSRVLKRYVDQRGRVYFHALAQNRGDLDLFLRHVAKTSLDTLTPGPAQLAHLINAYNALSMAHVIDSGFPTDHNGLNRLRFFVLSRFDLGDKRHSLQGLENEVIRPLGRSQGDPRLHFALNCMAMSCPVLPQQPFTQAGLEQELEREAKAFFAREENFRIDHAERTVWLSEVLDFYREDFTPWPATSVMAYANRYATSPAPLDYRVRFTPYDWTVTYAQ